MLHRRIATLARTDLAYCWDKVRALDLETTVRKMPDDTWDPMPYGPDAERPRIILHGSQRLNARAQIDSPGTTISAFSPDFPMILVGHNLKFDLQHLRAARQTIPPDQIFWDTMIAEYILTGQQSKFVDLGALSVKYGHGPLVDLIGTNLALGITPDKIPRADLEAYLTKDLMATSLSFIEQWAHARPEQRQLIMIQSCAMAAYADMEYNGLVLDTAVAVTRRDDAEKQIKHYRAAIRNIWNVALTLTSQASIVADMGEFPPDLFTTPRALSAGLFGTPTTLDFKIPLTPTLRAKYGFTAKRKFMEINIRVPFVGGRSVGAPFVPADFEMEVRDLKLKTGWFRTDDEVLTLAAADRDVMHSPGRAIAESALQLRKYEKLHGTYYQALLEHRERYGDKLVHHKIHSVSTNTGRTSSASPNAQNQPDEVREIFTVSDPANVLMEVDFSQLEVCALAQLTKDPDLIEAVETGDMHFESGKRVFGWKTIAESKADEKNRRATKSVNFGLIYGGSAPTLAAQSGFPVETVRELIKGFYQAFPGVGRWQSAFFKRVAATPDKTEVCPGTVGTRLRNTVKSETGREYVFTEELSPDWLYRKTKLRYSFKPTQTKNYPVQGLATGDWVPLAVTLLREVQPAWMILRNVVHDSILVEIPKDRAVVAQNIFDDVVTHMPFAIKDLGWGELVVPLKVTFKVGPYWSARDEA